MGFALVARGSLFSLLFIFSMYFPLLVSAGPICNVDWKELDRVIFKRELDSIERRFSTSTQDFSPEVDARRFINSDDWAKAKRELVDRPHLYYSEKSFRSWQNAALFVKQEAKRTGNEVSAKGSSGAPISSNLLQKIHSLAMEDMPFHGFEGRRIRLRYERGEIDHATFKRLLSEAYEQNANPSGVDHKSLLGRLRDDPIDEITHGGSSWDPSRGRYFTREELEAARKNPHMTVDESSVVEFEPGKFEAKTTYTTPLKVKSAVDKVFKTLNEDLSKAKSKEDVIYAVAKMEKDLVIIHPFLDGNGRTIRLMGDLIFERYGLPPPILLVEEELTTSVDDFARQIQLGMRLYVDEREQLTLENRGGK